MRLDSLLEKARLLKWRWLTGLVGALVAVPLLVQFRVPPEMSPAPEKGLVRVVTYNMRAGLGGIDEIAEDLRRLGASVIALQEVERGVRRSRQVDQAGTLGEALAMHSTFASSFSVESGEHGIAILSRHPISRVDTLRLPQGNGRWPRVALIAEIDDPGGTFLLTCLHLARPFGWPMSNLSARLAQIEAVLDRLEDRSLPVVVAGDFNSFPISLEASRVKRELEHAWKPWRDGWATTFSLKAMGWPGGSIKIDHIFHEKDWTSRGNWVAAPGASDHRAVIADLRRPRT